MAWKPQYAGRRYRLPDRPRLPLRAVSNACSTLNGRREAADHLAPQATVQLQATAQVLMQVRARRQNTDC